MSESKNISKITIRKYRKIHNIYICLQFCKVHIITSADSSSMDGKKKKS